MEKAAVYEILRIVRDVEPPLLSAKLSSIDTLPNVAANRRTEPETGHPVSRRARLGVAQSLREGSITALRIRQQPGQ